MKIIVATREDQKRRRYDPDSFIHEEKDERWSTDAWFRSWPTGYNFLDRYVRVVSSNKRALKQVLLLAKGNRRWPFSPPSLDLTSLLNEGNEELAQELTLVVSQDWRDCRKSKADLTIKELLDWFKELEGPSLEIHNIKAQIGALNATLDAAEEKRRHIVDRVLVSDHLEEGFVRYDE